MSENTDKELKPCPFCGGKAHLLTSNGSFLVECSVCLTDFLNGPVGIGWYRSEKDAAADWNDRPSERALIAQLEAAQKELSAANEKHGWIKRSDQMPDPNQQRRVCVFTPNDAADLRYRLVPANLFKVVCSSATHWHYVNDPVEGNADAE
ncbi:Lar family restriction alleviation protein [Yersinia mollaretii]|uniref:Lar family restriction alleviation protein n=1 Tax=Yersinia mollaretii TaxID=33060 RepID=UPI0011A99983|nr:Lar family restriction alleviation protein [Yersinia mollaretii]